MVNVRELKVPRRMAPALGLHTYRCSRCFTGMDDDGDGNCAVCCDMDVCGALAFRLQALANCVRNGKLAHAEALAKFALDYPIAGIARGGGGW